MPRPSRSVGKWLTVISASPWKLQEKALQALKDMDPSEIDPKNLVAFIREATKLERENRMELEADTAPGKANEQADSSLARRHL